jgi:hypothetical protein
LEGGSLLLDQQECKPVKRAKGIPEPHYDIHLAAKIALCVILAILLLCLIVIGILEANPSVPPTITTNLPSPNAYDYYKRAAQKVKETNQSLQKQLTPDGRHYAPSEKYRPLFASITGKDSSGSIISNALLQKASRGRPVFTFPQKEAVLAAYAEAHKEFQAGLTYDFQVPPAQTKSESYNAELSLYLPRTFLLKAQIHEHKGEWAKAMETRLDILKFGSDLQKGGSSAVGVNASWHLASRNIEQIISHLTEAEAVSSLMRLQQIADGVVPYEQMIREFRKETARDLLEFFQKHSYAWHAHLDTFTDRPPSKFEAWTLSRRRFFALFMDIYYAEERRIKKPYGAYLASKRVAKNPIELEIQDFLELMYFEYVQDRVTCLEMWKLRLALRAYFAKKNSYPATLQDLVSAGYLTSIPTDIFANDGQFRYRKERQGYRLYSVGPDGVDDGGTPIETIMGYFLADADDKGDIVVGYSIK